MSVQYQSQILTEVGEKCTSCRSAQNANSPQTLACLFSLKSKQGAKQTRIFSPDFCHSLEFILTPILLQLHCLLFSSFPWHLAVPHPSACASTDLSRNQATLSLTVLLPSCIQVILCFHAQKWNAGLPSRLPSATLQEHSGDSLPLLATPWAFSDKDLIRARGEGNFSLKDSVETAWSLLPCGSIVLRTSQRLLHHELLLLCFGISSNLHTPYYFAFLIGPMQLRDAEQLMGTSQKAVWKSKLLDPTIPLLPHQDHHSHSFTRASHTSVWGD